MIDIAVQKEEVIRRVSGERKERIVACVTIEKKLTLQQMHNALALQNDFFAVLIRDLRKSFQAALQKAEKEGLIRERKHSSDA